jgi:DNA-binding NarL/FixJ family response regulator
MDAEVVLRGHIRTELAAELDLLEDLHRRVDQLERRPALFTTAEQRRQRRAAVMYARAEGLSVAMISRLLGLSRNTVSRILSEVEDSPPPSVLGADGRSYRARDGVSSGA